MDTRTQANSGAESQSSQHEERGAAPSGAVLAAVAPTRSTGRPWRTSESYVLVFSSSLCMLVLELVAGRLLAPTIGVSLFTWTSVIGVVLAGVAVGNTLGGLIARRAASPTTLGGVLLASSAVTWGVALLVRAIDLNTLFDGLVPLARIVTLVAALFLLPSALLGMVTPMVAQLTLRQRAEAGAVVGRLGAVSAAGSIAGTFLTGFWLVPTFGTRAIVAGVAVALAALALLAAYGRVRMPGAGGWAAAAAALALVGATSSYAFARNENACLRETAYYCSRVLPGSFQGVEYGIVLHDRITQGYTALAEPRLLVGDWIQAVADVVAYQSAGRRERDPGPLRALFIGGGSYTLPRYLEAVYPGSVSGVLEIDPGVTATARERLGLRTDRSIHVMHGDARLAIRELPDNAYDLVYGDAFSDLAVPWHLTTVEFAR